MKIPKSFNIMGQTIEVKYDPQLTNRSDHTGEAHYRYNQIILQGAEGYPGRPISQIEQTFMHELVHFILYYGDCTDTKDLFKNELVVDRIAMLLHQAFTTMEYEE